EYKNNATLTPTTCGVLGCKSEIIQNNTVISDVIFSGQVNPNNNTSKVTIEVTNRSNNEVRFVTSICLPSNECKFFLPAQFENANYAYNNGEFVKQREKRNASPYRETLKWVGGSMVGAWVGSQFNDFNNNIGNMLQKINQHRQDYLVRGGGISRTGGGSYLQEAHGESDFQQ
ncbi:hypothetical protein, partial [Silvanigrella aquatica]|uniref:hypothetical protein n=1 Tax=Silvanigrella aquatica TaxID=1915309 RepID=UPI001E47048A